MNGCPQCGAAMDPGETICLACGRDWGLAHDDDAPARTRTEGPSADPEAQEMLAAVHTGNSRAPGVGLPAKCSFTSSMQGFAAPGKAMTSNRTLPDPGCRAAFQEE